MYAVCNSAVANKAHFASKNKKCNRRRAGILLVLQMINTKEVVDHVSGFLTDFFKFLHHFSASSVAIFSIFISSRGKKYFNS
jgi:hypothetical protein